MQNASEAVKWFRSAAAQDRVDAQFFLAVLLQKGIGTPRDAEAAAAWFRRAADHGSRLAMLELATAYDLGLGVVADPAMAKSLRESARLKPGQTQSKTDDPSAGAQRVEPGRSKP